MPLELTFWECSVLNSGQKVRLIILLGGRHKWCSAACQQLPLQPWHQYVSEGGRGWPGKEGLGQGKGALSIKAGKGNPGREGGGSAGVSGCCLHTHKLGSSGTFWGITASPSAPTPHPTGIDWTHTPIYSAHLFLQSIQHIWSSPKIYYITYKSFKTGKDHDGRG